MPAPITKIGPPPPLSDANDPSREGFKRRLERMASLVGSQNALAKRAAVPQSTIRKYFTRGEAPSTAVIALAAAAQVRPEWLLTGSGAMPVEHANFDDQKVASTIDDVVFLPLYSARRIGLSTGRTLEDYAVLEDYLPFKRSWLKHHVSAGADRVALLHVFGDAMEPLLKDGDVALIDLTQDQIREGIYAIIIAEQLAIKRLQLNRSTLRIISEHKSYAPIEIPAAEIGGRISLVGRVFGNIQNIF